MKRTPTSIPPLTDFVLRHAKVVFRGSTFQQFNTSYTLKPRTVCDYNLIYPLRGTIVWVVDGVKHRLKPCDLIVVPPAVPHHGYSTTKHMTLVSLHIDMVLPSGRDAFELAKPPLVRTLEKNEPLDRYLQGIAAEYDRDNPIETQHVIDRWSSLIGYELIRRDAAHGLIKNEKHDPLIVTMLEELEQRIATATTLTDLEEVFGYSAQHLNRMFRRELGVTPLQYLTSLRLDTAAEALAHSAKTVKAIAASVGYDDPYYFSRLFTQHFGESPTEHRLRASSDSPS